MNRLILCTVSLAILAGTSAYAGQAGAERQIVVRYDDINVRQSAGAQILMARIDAASHEVCGPAPDMRQLGLWQAFKSCARTAEDRAVASLPFNLMAALQGSNANEALASR